MADAMDIDENPTTQTTVNNSTQPKKPDRKRSCLDSTTKHLQNIVPHRTFQSEHSTRTKLLLNSLMRQHNWKQASGVMCAVIKATSKEKFPIKNRDKYRAALELLTKVSRERVSPSEIYRIYEVWMRKNGPMKKWPPKDKYSVQLELALFWFLRGDITKAREVIMSLMQESNYKRDPVLNMMAGFIYYELWYASIPEEWKLRYTDIDETPTLSEISGAESYNQVRYSDLTSKLDIRGVVSPARCDSECSVGNYKECPIKSEGVTPTKPSNQVFNPQGFYMEGSEMTGNEEAPLHNDIMSTSIFKSRGLDANLLPIRFPEINEDTEEFFEFYMQMFNSDYHKAVECLANALKSTPPVLASLLPLVQLLLLGDQVGEALKVLDDFCLNSDALLPLRLRAILLECFHNKQSAMLSTCYEDILKKDPRCSHSLTRLVMMHKNGDYDLEPLTEMIALHLDATYAESSVWEEFATCFHKFSQLEEDQMSVNDTASESVGNKHQASFKTIPKGFMQGKSRMTWKLRCRWWSMRHFSKNAYISEMEAGDLRLSTFKAACASHLYGPDFAYVVSVCTHLEKEEEEGNDSLLFLQLHMKNSMKVFEHVNRSTCMITTDSSF